jgi:hypothetical protein
MSTNFSYFDQFKDVEISLIPYLNEINTNSTFKYTLTNIQSVKVTLKNLFDRVDVVSDFKKNLLYFDRYVVENTMNIENVAYNFYGTTDYWWIISIFNDIKFLPTDWVMTEDQLQQMALKMFQKEGRFSLQTYYEALAERNESKKNILILQPYYINEVISRFRIALGTN